MVDRPPQETAFLKALFIVNERSGRRRTDDVADVIRRGSFEYEIARSHAASDLDSLVDHAEAAGFDVVVAVGGDGTVHETARRLIGRGPALGILPTGSGNGFARHIGLPVDPAAALAACGTGRIVTIDTATVNGRPFLGVMGIGFDAVVAERFATSTVRGLETYVREGLTAFARFQPEEYEITTRDGTSRSPAFVVAVANSGQYGNNARIAPLASLQDGLLDIVVVSDPGILQAPLLLARLFAGSFHRASAVRSMQSPEVRITRRAPGPAHLDGEPVSLGAELNVRVVPHSLRLLVPESSTRL
jgi:YegS/Rv2252/BmrU family lipid kinase